MNQPTHSNLIPMNAQLFIRRIALVAGLALALFAASPARAAESVAVHDNIYNYLELLRSDFNSAKVEIINRIMKLSASEAETFWPLYREYEAQLAQQAVDRAEFVAEFVQSNRENAFDNARARTMAKRWFKMQRARLDLLEKYHRRIEKALSSVHAGQFLQIENQLTLFIDLTIASEMPLIGETKK
jgi:hypothetical protein